MKFIMTPAAVASWVFGVSMLLINPGLLAEAWLHVKLLFVVGLTASHFAMNGWRQSFADDNNHRSERFFRIANEVPTIALIVIVIMVIVRPF